MHHSNTPPQQRESQRINNDENIILTTPPAQEEDPHVIDIDYTNNDKENEEDHDASVLHNELLKWHNCLGHMSFKKLKYMAE